jgi:hypothetical protein
VTTRFSVKPIIVGILRQKMKHITFLSIFLAFHTIPAFADAASGNAHQQGCRIVLDNKTPSDRMEAAQAMQCLTTVSVVLRMGYFLDRKLRFCRPEGVTVVEGLSVVMKFMDDHPADTDQNFVDLTLRALKVAWPCSGLN